MITQQQRDLRNAIVKHAEEANLDLNTTTYSLIVVLGSVIEGIPVERAMGSPGSWGYGTPIGDALLALIQSRPATNEMPSKLIDQLVTEGGAIVTSDECSEMEIADAQATGRFSVREDGIGFVRRYAEWLALQRASIIPKLDEKIKSSREWGDVLVGKDCRADADPYYWMAAGLEEFRNELSGQNDQSPSVAAKEKPIP